MSERVEYPPCWITCDKMVEKMLKHGLCHRIENVRNVIFNE